MANTKDAEKDCTVPLRDLRKLKGAGKKAWPLSWVVPLVSSRRPPAVTVAVPSRVRLAPEKPEKTNWSSLALTASTRLKPWNSRIWRRKESVIFVKAEVYLLVLWLLVTYGLKCSGFHLEIDPSTIVFWYYSTSFSQSM